MNIEQYAKTRLALKRLQAKVKDMELELLEEMNPGDAYKTNIGTVSVGTRKSWKYADSVKEEIKELQKDAQFHGDAEEVETTFIRFNTPRNL